MIYNDNMWKKLSSKVIFKHPRLIVEEDEVQIRSDRTIQYLKYGHGHNGVVLIARDKHNRVLFIREYSYVLNKRLLQLPMGKIETGESPKTAANRELQEETGFKASKLTLVGSYFQDHRRSKEKGYVLLATNLLPSRLVADQEEQDIEKVWVSSREITSLISKGEIVDNASLTSLRMCNL
jgi:ADP-ribose pyrophosphatase